MKKDSEELISRIEELSDEFTDLIQTRHNMGLMEYGRLAFLHNDVITFLLEELADTANYVRYLYIKYKLLEDILNERGIDLSASILEALGEQNAVSSDPPPFMSSEALQGFLSNSEQER